MKKLRAGHCVGAHWRRNMLCFASAVKNCDTPRCFTFKSCKLLVLVLSVFYPCHEVNMTTTQLDASTSVATRVKSAIGTLLFELELIVFLVTLLLTGYTNLILSQDQTIRPFYPHDATLWVSCGSKLICIHVERKLTISPV